MSRIFRSTGCVFRSRSYIGSVEPPATVLEDESRYGNDGAFLSNGNPDWVRLPSGLWVMSFDGDDDIDCGSDASLDIAGAFTVLLWFKSDSVEGTYGMVTKHTASSTPGTGFYLNRSAANLAFNFFQADGELKSANRSGVTTSWHFGATWYDLTNINAKIDALATVSTAVTGFAPANGQSLTLGRYSYAPGIYFSGKMDGVRIYNRALSAEDMAAIFQAERHWFGV